MSRQFLPAAVAALMLTAPMAAAPAFAQAAAAAPTAASAEALLRKNIAEITAGKANYAGMSDALAAALKARPEVPGQLASLGPIKSVTRAGTAENPWTFTVAYEAMSLNWTIAIGPDGKITVLVAQPAG